MTTIIPLAQLAKRDKWICHICGLRVDRLSDADREHLIPKAHGGSNRPENLALAHKWCNKLKGSKIFRVDQHGTGYVIVDPNENIVSDEYTTHAEAFTVAQDMNRDKLYMDPYYNQGNSDNVGDIIIIRRANDGKM